MRYQAFLKQLAPLLAEAYMECEDKANQELFTQLWIVVNRVAEDKQALAALSESTPAKALAEASAA